MLALGDADMKQPVKLIRGLAMPQRNRKVARDFADLGRPLASGSFHLLRLGFVHAGLNTHLGSSERTDRCCCDLHSCLVLHGKTS